VDGRGYAFPYDDVTPDGGHNQCGAVMDGSPQLFTVAFGGVEGMVEDYNRHAELECELRLFGIYVREYRLTVACKDEAS